MLNLLKAATTAVLLTVTAGAAAQPYVLLEAVRDGDGRPVTQSGADGVRLPVLKRAGATPLVAAINRVLATGFAARIPAIDAAARRAGRDTSCAGLPAALLIHLSDEDGGYARQGFVLADADGRTAPCRDHFIDITADEASVASGEFEEVLAHEWGHVLLRRVWGPVPPTPSRKFHSVRTVTDPVTAFDEGFGAHFQPLSARLTETPGYRARVEGTLEPRLAEAWFSRQETWARQALVPQNRFVFDKPTPAPGSVYDRWQADEASLDLDPCRLRSGAQMVASEGVTAAFFHKLLATEPATVEDRYRQLIEVLRRIGDWPTDGPAILTLVRAWGETFPPEREAVTKLFLGVTHGSTASAEAGRLAEKVTCAGAAGDIQAFLGAREAAQAARDRLLADVLAGRVAPGAAVGPQLWVASAGTRVPAAPWQGKRDRLAVVDLNTAREAELELAFEGTPLAGSAAAIVAARRAGDFLDLRDAARRSSLGEAGLRQLRAAADAFARAGYAVRQ